MYDELPREDVVLHILVDGAKNERILKGLAPLLSWLLELNEAVSICLTFTLLKVVIFVSFAFRSATVRLLTIFLSFRESKLLNHLILIVAGRT